MPAARRNLLIEQGAKFELEMVLKVEGTPINLTGYTVRAQVRTKRSPTATLIAELTVDVTPLEGRVILSLTAAETAELSFIKGEWDMELVPPSGENDARRLFQGKVDFSREVTVPVVVP